MVGACAGNMSLLSLSSDEGSTEDVSGLVRSKPSDSPLLVSVRSNGQSGSKPPYKKEAVVRKANSNSGGVARPRNPEGTRDGSV